MLSSGKDGGFKPVLVQALVPSSDDQRRDLPYSGAILGMGATTTSRKCCDPEEAFFDLPKLRIVTPSKPPKVSSLYNAPSA